MRRLSAILLIFTMFSVFAQEFSVPYSIVIDRTLSLRSKSWFGGKAYILGYLTPGTKAKVIGFDTEKKSGAGIKVQVETGPNKGKVGWIYYHKKPSKRNFHLLDQGGEKVTPKDDRFFDYFNIANNLLEIATEPESEKSIWENIRSGRYEIVDEESETPTDQISFRKAMIDRATGQTYYVVKQTPRRLEEMSRIIDPKSLNDFLNKCQEEDTSTFLDEGSNDEGFSWLPGCIVLSKHEFEINDITKMKQCFESIQKAITKNGKTMRRGDVLTNLFLKLNPIEQDFAGKVFTAWGEAGVFAKRWYKDKDGRINPHENAIVVMKVLDNRAREARRRGYDKANALDAAVQPWQFSMWNPNEPGWKELLTINKSHPWLHNSIEAFKKYKNSEFDPEEVMKKVYHYQREYVTWTDWSDPKKKVNIKVNGIEVSNARLRHDFYSDVKWGFKYTSYRRNADKLLERTQ